MRFAITDPTEAEIRHVIENAREKSMEDLVQVRDADPALFARHVHLTSSFIWLFYNDNRPAAILSATEQHKGVFSLFGIGTDDWIKVWRLVTLVAKRDMMRTVLDAGGHRAHTVSPASHTDTHKWLRFLGANHEAEMPEYGPNREDYILFSWLRR